MKTLFSNRFVSVILFTVANPALGWCYEYQGQSYRYIWTLDIALWRHELSIRWWNQRSARIIKS